MKLKPFIVLCLMFVFHTKGFSQIILDSETNITLINKQIADSTVSDSAKIQNLIKNCESCYQKIAYGNIKYNPQDQCIAQYKYGSQLLALAEKSKDKEAICIGYFYKGLELELLNKEDEAEKCYLKWCSLRQTEQKKIKNSTKVRWAYDYLVGFYKRTLQIGKAEKTYLLWYKTAQKDKKHRWAASGIAHQIGNFYYQIANYEKAIMFFDLAIDSATYLPTHYRERISPISEKLLAKGQIKTAIEIDNHFLENLKKKDEILFRIYLIQFMANNRYLIYQDFFLEKLVTYLKQKFSKNPQKGLETYREFYPISLHISLQKKYLQNWLTYIDQNCKTPISKLQAYHDLNKSLYDMSKLNLKFEIIWHELLPRVEKLPQNESKSTYKAQFYDDIVIIMREYLNSNNYLKEVVVMIKDTEKIEQKKQKNNADKADLDFLQAMEKEINFARKMKIKNYQFWSQ
jgi:hypothetical protein